MVSSLCFSPVFLPSLGDIGDQDCAAMQDISTPLFDDLMADPRFEDLRRCLDAPAPDQIQIEFTTPGIGNHPVATVLPQADESNTETTVVIPVVDLPTAELPVTVPKDDDELRDREIWLPDVGGPTHPRQQA